MPAKIKRKYKSQMTIDSEMPDFSADPVFVKKAEEAAAFLKKHPLPEEFLKKIKEKNKK